MTSEKMVCIVCGRTFYKGQGVVIEAAGRKLIFHSKSCAIKFIRSLLTYLDPSDLGKAIDEAVKEFSERLEALKKAREKKLS